MIDKIYEWIRNLSVYLILITVVLNVLPDNSYKKYVKFFSGMLLVLILISPLAGLFGVGEKINISFESNNYRQELKEIQSKAKYMEGKQSQKVAEGNENSIKAQVENIIRKNGFYPVSVEINTDQDINSKSYGEIQSILASASDKTEEERSLVEEIRIGNNARDADTEAIIKQIADFYHISEGHININIQR